MTDEARGFGYELASQDGTTVVRFRGELDLETAPQVSECLERLLGDGSAAIVVDLGSVEFCDSSGLAALVGARQAAERAGRVLFVRSASPNVARIFELTNLIELFDGSARDR